MSGGQLVVLDRLGRDVKRYPLPEGLATIGSDPACDIRVMLSSVSPHHATVVVHANQTVVRNVSTGETLVNGRPVSVAALRHRDRIELGGRLLRWEYSQPAAPRPLAPQPVPARRGRARAPRAGRPRRATAGPGAAPRSPALRLHLEMSARASMPGAVGGKQVAIVQPQRRDTAEQNEESPSRQYAASSKRSRAASPAAASTAASPAAAAPAASPAGEPSKRKARRAVSSPLALQGTTKATLWIESRKSSPRIAGRAAPPAARRRAASATPLRLAVLKKHRPAPAPAKIQAPTEIDPTKQAAILLMAGRSARPSPAAPPPPPRRTTHTPKITQIEINDSRQSSASGGRSPLALGSPKKSALKDPSAKRAGRKTDSIKFDLSNLDHRADGRDSSLVSDTTRATRGDNTSEDDDVTLHYDTSTVSPSPRRSIHSRSGRILERTLGAAPAGRPATSLRSASTPGTPRNRKSSRGSIIVQRVLDTPADRSERYSTRSSKSASEQSYETTVQSSFGRRSPSRRELESYSIVDLVSGDSVGSPSEYGSGRSRASSAAADSPRRAAAALHSSTPYGGQKAPRGARSRDATGADSTLGSRGGRRSRSAATPENSQRAASAAARVSRGPRSRSRINDTDLLLISSLTEVEDSSPKSSRRFSRNDTSVAGSPLPPARTSARKTRLTVTVSPASPAVAEGATTPDDGGSPEEAGTPVLSIQSLLDSSLASSTARRSARMGRVSKRNTIGGGVRKKSTGAPAKSRSFILVPRRSGRGRSELSPAESDETGEGAPAPGDEDIVTPKSALKLVPEDLKNKHSTAKKPQSKRAIIDDLNESDIVKQLFNSPVKRKLSQSMSEYSRRQLLEEEAAAAAGARPRKSVKNDLTRVSGVKNIFARSPRNRLSDVRVKELFAPSPENDLRRVSGVKALFRSKTPNDDLRDVRGVKKLFSDGPVDDLRNVSGVKRTLRRNSPRNDLSDVRGVRNLFRRERERADALSNVSGVEELFDESGQSAGEARRPGRAHLDVEALFDRLLGRPPVKAVYSKTFSKKFARKPKSRRAKSLHASIDEIRNNVEEWLERELQKRLSGGGASKGGGKVSRELSKLATDTVEGGTPLRAARGRSGAAGESRGETSQDGSPGRKRPASQVYSARRLPLKKRSWAGAAAGAGVLHSTPLKGGGARLGALQLARVSPIAPPRDQRPPTSIRTEDLRENESSKTASRTKSKIETSKTESLKISPEKTRATETPNVSPKKTRASQAAGRTSAAGKSPTTRNTTNSQVHNVKKRGSSLVVTKKAPVLSPRPDNKATRKSKVDSPKRNSKDAKKVDDSKEKIEVEVASPKSPAASPKKRSTRRQKVNNSTDKKVETSTKTPKRTTRAKVQRVSLVVSKPSPKMKPVATKAKDVQPEQKRRTRKTTVPSESTDKVKGKQTIESPEKPVTRTRRNAEVGAKSKGRQTKPAVAVQTKSDQKSPKTRQTRGRKAEKSVQVLQDKKTAVNDTAQPTRGKKTDSKQSKAEVVKATNTRNRPDTKQNKENIEIPKTRGRRAEQNKVAEVTPTRGKKAKAAVEVVQESKRTRGKRNETENSAQSEGKRGQKAKTKMEKVVAEVAPTRGRRTKVNEEVVQDSKRTRGKRVESDQLEAKQGQKGKAKAEDKSRKRKSTVESDVPSKIRKTRSEDVAQAKGRGRKAAELEKEVKNVEKTRATRTRAVVEQTETTATRAARRPQTKASLEPQAGGRKRKSVADATDKPGKGRKQPAAKKSKVVAETPKKGSRTRAAVAEGGRRARR